MRKAKLALVQFESEPMRPEANVRKALRFVRDAGERGADLVVFPELFVTGYDTDRIGVRYRELAEPVDGPIVNAFRIAAKSHGVNLVVPMALKLEENGAIGNGAVVIDREGKVAGVYSKVHLWEDERNYFTPGRGFQVFKMDFGKLGVLICYDAGFPEAARTLALQGAELLVVPSAFSLPDKHRWDLYFPARALENTRFVAAVNGVGGAGAFELFGNNKVANPRGELLLDGAMNEETMQLLEIDLAQNEKTSSSIPYLRDLRIETYGYRA
ncbi:nitrilase-related carbon-nitrogen hydrolase [Cohnella massiliensis]|uniref:nitrilase-related carbon-nitrogen hydrolase n=1 Tax=Cohnella massiliensis TaxID=1816691 RepID=UPI0009BB4B63|nr:nitrilase-related carbon-nitrogen hydrolase [Cohnella massiliensis]